MIASQSSIHGKYIVDRGLLPGLSNKPKLLKSQFVWPFFMAYTGHALLFLPCHAGDLRVGLDGCSDSVLGTSSAGLHQCRD